MRVHRRLSIGCLIIGCVAALAAAGCSDSGPSTAEQLAEEPTAQLCFEAAMEFFDRIEVPPGYNPTNGVDEAERVVARAAVDAASTGLYDPTDLSHPCATLLPTLSAEQQGELLGSMDSGVVDMLTLLQHP